jgi:polysaccharide export outer membrane protein
VIIHMRKLAAVLAGLFTLGAAMAAGAQQIPPAQATLTPAAAPAVKSYVLGPEDVIEVSVLGRTDFTTRAKISADGTIQLPYLGTVRAVNSTSEELREQIRAELEKGGYFTKPILSVNIVSYASRYVTVLGSVVTPGLVPVDRPYRLSELLARVGGAKDDAADYLVLRSDKQAERHLLIKTLATGDESQDPFVAPGDKIYVPLAELFYISGQIKAPGAYPLATDMTLRMAISRGGGLTDAGSERRIRLTRHGKRVARFELDQKIESGDVIVVGERLF